MRTIGLRFSLYQKLSKLRKKIFRRFFANFCHEIGCENDQTYIFRFVRYFSTFFYTYLPINIHFQFIIRDLTCIGKVTVIKTLVLPILVQCLTVLPNPPDSILNDIEQIFYKFLWNGKKEKIKRSIIINEYEEGGLQMPNIQSFNKALKMSWLHKLLDPFNHSPWKVLLLGSMQKWGGSNILYLSKEGLEKIAEKVNPF